MVSTIRKPKHRFELEVHIGLLLIIFLLFFLTFLSNTVIHRARTRLYDKWTANFGTVSRQVNRTVSGYSPYPVPDSVRASLCTQYHLKDLCFVASRPMGDSPAAKRQWIASVITALPQGDIKRLADYVFGANFGEMNRGDAGEYYVVMATTTGSGYPLVAMAQDIPELAYLDDASRTVFILSVISLIMVGALYFYLSRYIFEPIRRLRDAAQKAGRQIDGDVSEADAVVEDYRNALAELERSHEELKKLNAALSAKADTLEQFSDYLLKSTESGVMSLDMSGNILACNDTAARLLSISSRAIAGQNYRTILASSAVLCRLIENVYAADVIPAYSETTAGEATLGVSMSFIRNTEGLRVGLWLLLFDLTEVAALRSQLEIKNRLSALGEMSGGLAHQLRNSMGAISGYGLLVKKKLQIADAPIEQIDALLTESKQAENLIRRFLNFSRPFDYSPAVAPIDPLVTEIVETFRVRGDLPPVRLSVKCRAKAQVSVDSLLFKQAMGNLLENAMRACASVGQVRPPEVVVETTAHSDEVVITVSDNGCGIPADKLNKVFTPFYSSRPDGTGLGLPLAARIVDLHGGRLTLSSRQDEGSVATLVLPLVSAHEPVTGHPVAV